MSTIKPVDLEGFHQSRAEAGAAPARVDLELSTMRGMICRDFYNNLVDGRVLKAFKTVKNRLKMGATARDRVAGC